MQSISFYCLWKGVFFFFILSDLDKFNLNLIFVSDYIGDKGPLWCTHCKGFYTSDFEDLRIHCKACTSMPRPKARGRYVCYQCNYNAATLGPWKSHVFQHLGVKPYKCHLCTFACTVKSSLFRHIRQHGKIKSPKIKIIKPPVYVSSKTVVLKKTIPKISVVCIRKK